MADIKTAMGQMIQNEKDNLAKVLDAYFKDNPKVYNIEFVAAHTTYLNIGCVNAKYGGKYYVQYALNEILRDSSGYTLVISQWGDNPSDESEYINLADIYPLPGELTELTEVVKKVINPVENIYHFDAIQTQRIEEFNRALTLLHEADVALIIDVDDNCVGRFANGEAVDYFFEDDDDDGVAIDVKRLPKTEYEGQIIGIDTVLTGQPLRCYWK